MKQRGAITVFLSMSLLCVSALLCVMLESARTAGSRYYFQVAAGGALDTVFSRYHRRLWEDYRIFATEYGSQEELVRELEYCMDQYLAVSNWYPIRLEGVEITGLTGIADGEGEALAGEVLSYMKYGILDSLFIGPDQGEQYIKDITEGAKVHVLTGVYNDQEKEVRKLEQAVESLLKLIRELEKLGKEIEKALDADNASGFFRAAGKYRKTAAGYPEKMERYRRQADKLRKKQQESRKEIDQVRSELQENRGELFDRQWNPYDAYLEEDGTRRKELEQWQNEISRNLELLAETEELTERLLNDEESEEPSLEAAARLWRRRSKNSSLVQEGNSGDKEKRNLLDQVQKLAGGKLLEVVLPEGVSVSDKAFFTGNLPSKCMGTKGEGSSGMEARREEKEGSSPGKAVTERVIINEYCGQFFPNALSKEEQGIQYGLEYLLQGEGTDRENLEKTVAELLAVREGLNLIHILSDAQKRGEARALALVITGSTGLAPLAEIMACVIMGVWALGESIQDLRILMDGGNVPLRKQKGDWNLGLEAPLDMGKGQMPGTGEAGSAGRGFSYQEYLKLLLLKEKPQVKHMRMLDVMQLKISEKQPGFLIKDCAYGVDIRAKASGKHLFFALPFVENLVNGTDGYPLEAAAGKTY